jgi:hypothetical protein
LSWPSFLSFFSSSLVPATKEAVAVADSVVAADSSTSWCLAALAVVALAVEALVAEEAVLAAAVALVEASAAVALAAAVPAGDGNFLVCSGQCFSRQ